MGLHGEESHCHQDLGSQSVEEEELLRYVQSIKELAILLATLRYLLTFDSECLSSRSYSCGGGGLTGVLSSMGCPHRGKL